jgi:hypothetical protein
VNPAVKFRKRIRRVYVVRGIQAVSRFRPRIGFRTAKAARLGIVYRMPVRSVIGG